MASEVLEYVAGGFYGFVDVKALHRARRAGGHAVVEGQHHCGLVIEFCKARGHDAYDATMPVFVVDDDRFLVGAVLAAGLEYGVGLFGDTFVELLAVLIVAVDLLPFFVRFGGVAGHKQIHGLTSALHASGGVDAGADLEDHVGDGDLTPAQTADAYYRSESEVGIGVETAQAVIGHDTVFVDHRHDVGGNADSHQVEHPFEFGSGDAVGNREGLHELVAHSASRQV